MCVCNRIMILCKSETRLWKFTYLYSILSVQSQYNTVIILDSERVDCLPFVIQLDKRTRVFHLIENYLTNNLHIIE